MGNRAQRITRLALCSALALVLSYLEALLPPIYPAIPGIKMGLANVVIIFVLYCFGLGSAVWVSALRLFMMTLLFGNVMMLLYSLAGATLSLCAMALLKRIGWFSPVGVSVTGGVCHNIGQILVAMVVLRTRTIGYYLPVLTVTGTVAGILVGFLGVLLMNKIGNVAEKGGEM